MLNEQNSTPQGWPTGIMLKSVSPGQSFKERVEELLGRTVDGEEKMVDVQAELMSKAPDGIMLMVHGVRSVEH